MLCFIRYIDTGLSDTVVMVAPTVLLCLADTVTYPGYTTKLVVS